MSDSTRVIRILAVIFLIQSIVLGAIVFVPGFRAAAFMSNVLFLGNVAGFLCCAVIVARDEFNIDMLRPGDAHAEARQQQSKGQVAQRRANPGPSSKKQNADAGQSRSSARQNASHR